MVTSFFSDIKDNCIIGLQIKYNKKCAHSVYTILGIKNVLSINIYTNIITLDLKSYLHSYFLLL